ncbi:MAG: N-acetylmuramoyl-L-alanine amidase [Candidatus Poribacteria bacterium]|nr:N-acetylmuramoyl-L-alanine amidase [Candidatus Poribacteria bacterium]
MSSQAFEALVEKQRSMAVGGAKASEWEALAAQFEAVAAESSASPRAGDALYGVGLSYTFSESDASIAKGVAAFERLLTTFPDSPHRANALYWCARLYERQRDTANAQRRYLELVNRYPDNRHFQDAWDALMPRRVVASAAPIEVSRPEPPPESIAEPREFPTFRAEGSSLDPLNRMSQQLGLQARTIVVDAGHGGKDPGSSHDGVQEKAITLAVSRMLAARLAADGFDVIMSREDDTFIDLRPRNDFARARNAELFLSIHANAAESTQANGIETWIGSLTRDADAARVAARENMGAAALHETTDLLAQLLTDTKSGESRALATEIQRELVAVTGARDRGVKEAAFVVLLGLRVPSVIVEMGFITNPEERARLVDPAYQERLADGIAAGVRRYLASLTFVP